MMIGIGQPQLVGCLRLLSGRATTPGNQPGELQIVFQKAWGIDSASRSSE